MEEAAERPVETDKKIEEVTGLSNWTEKVEIERIAREAFGEEWNSDALSRNRLYTAGADLQFVFRSRVGSELAGFAIVQPVARTTGRRRFHASNTTAEISDLAVAKKHRGAGRGSRMLKDAEEQARADGYGHVVLRCDESELAFFEKNGYTIAPAGHAFTWLERESHPVPPAKRIPGRSTWVYGPTERYTRVARKELRPDSVIATIFPAGDETAGEAALAATLAEHGPINWKPRQSPHGSELVS